MCVCVCVAYLAQITNGVAKCFLVDGPVAGELFDAVVGKSLRMRASTKHARSSALGGRMNVAGGQHHSSSREARVSQRWLQNVCLYASAVAAVGTTPTPMAIVIAVCCKHTPCMLACDHARTATRQGVVRSCAHQQWRKQHAPA